MKNKRFADSFKNAWAGITHTAKNERNFRFHLFAAVLAVAACVFFRVDAAGFTAVVFAVVLVLCLELVNTAVEAAIDLVCGEKLHPLAKTAKDAAAGAVAIAVAGAVIIAGIVAWGVLTKT